MTKSELRKRIAKAMSKARVDEAIAKGADDYSEVWYQMGLRHGLKRVEGALEFNLLALID